MNEGNAYAPKMQKPDEKPVAVCFRCGSPLRLKDIAATVKGRITFWETRGENLDGTFHLCHSCNKSGMEVQKGGVEAAIKRAKGIVFIEDPVHGGRQ